MNDTLLRWAHLTSRWYTEYENIPAAILIDLYGAELEAVGPYFPSLLNLTEVLHKAPEAHEQEYREFLAHFRTPQMAFSGMMGAGISMLEASDLEHMRWANGFAQKIKTGYTGVALVNRAVTCTAGVLNSADLIGFGFSSKAFAKLLKPYLMLLHATNNCGLGKPLLPHSAEEYYNKLA